MMFRAVCLSLAYTGVASFMPPSFRPDGSMVDNTEVFYSNDPWNDHFEGAVPFAYQQQQQQPQQQQPPFGGPPMGGPPHPDMQHPDILEQQQWEHEQQMMMMHPADQEAMMMQNGGGFYGEDPRMMMMPPPYPFDEQPMYDPNNMMDRSFQADTPLNSNEASPSHGRRIIPHGHHQHHHPAPMSDINNNHGRGLGKPMEFAFADTKQDPRETVVGPPAMTGQPSVRGYHANKYNQAASSFAYDE